MGMSQLKMGIEAYSVVVLDLTCSTKASYLIGGQEFTAH